MGIKEKAVTAGLMFSLVGSTKIAVADGTLTNPRYNAANNQFSFNVPTNTTHLYNVQVTPSLDNPIWTTVAQDVLPGGTYVTTVNPTAKNFYRTVDGVAIPSGAIKPEKIAATTNAPSVKSK
jgi:hypothetical protein